MHGGTTAVFSILAKASHDSEAKYPVRPLIGSLAVAIAIHAGHNYFDLRPHLAFNDQATQLSDVIAALTERGVHEPLVFVRGLDTVPVGVIAVGVPLDLRVPGTPYPHELFANGVRPDAVVYE